MKLSKEQVLETLMRYFPGEMWEEIAEDEDYLRLCLGQRVFYGETCLDNYDQFVIYTGISEDSD